MYAIAKRRSGPHNTGPRLREVMCTACSYVSHVSRVRVVANAQSVSQCIFLDLPPRHLSLYTMRPCNLPAQLPVTCPRACWCKPQEVSTTAPQGPARGIHDSASRPRKRYPRHGLTAPQEVSTTAPHVPVEAIHDIGSRPHRKYPRKCLTAPHEVSTTAAHRPAGGIHGSGSRPRSFE